jgi:shikimate kinase
VTLPAGSIVLVGAPGSGKSTVGPRLAARLDRGFVDVDKVIEERAGKPVADIFVDDGEPAFRALEEATTLELLDRPAVLSLGGGAVLSETIRTALTGHQVIWLQVSAGTAADRVGLSTARPLLLGNVRGRLIQLLNQRTPLYAEVSTIAVATDDRSADEVVAVIVDSLS